MKKFLILSTAVFLFFTVGYQSSIAEVQSSDDINSKDLPYTPVVTLNGSTLPWKMVDGVKEFHLTVEEAEWEVAPGMKIKALGLQRADPRTYYRSSRRRKSPNYCDQQTPRAHRRSLARPSSP